MNTILKLVRWLTLLRVLRLVIGALLIAAGYSDREPLLVAIGLFVLVQGILYRNCGPGSCEID